jgi:D-xylose 1-dehydrogenase (NADP+, D-xylono-1,5-lactone-forming)
MTVRWGILGAAAIAKEKVMPAIQASNGTIQAIASRSQNVDELAKHYQIEEVYGQYEQLLESDKVDAVYIPLPNSLHYKWVMKALKSGKHVLVEKPIVLDVQQMMDIKQYAEAKNLVVMEAFMYRYHPQIEAAKRMLQAGEIGEVISMRSQFHFVLQDWKNDIRITPKLGGGVLYDIGCYCINIQQYMLGEQMANAAFLTEKYNDVDVKVSGSVQYANGVIGQIDCSFLGHFTETFDVIGTKGMLRLPHAFRTDVNEHTGIVEIYKEKDTKKYYYDGDSYQLQIEHFEQVMRGELPKYSLEEMLSQVQTLTTLYEKL